MACIALTTICPAFVGASDAWAENINVVVTGTNIPRVARENALPVQVITREEIAQTNLQTAAQLVNTITASMSFLAFNESQGLRAMGGFAGASLRGLAYQFTLVLVNGRRIAHSPLAARGADLNSIPLSAVERVEVLKDGASAIYGSDAIAGVINFILRKEYDGTEISAQYTSPEHSGGYAKRVTAWAGAGDLTTQMFNVYVNVDYQKFGGIQARDRTFAMRTYVPEEGLDRTESISFPANVRTSNGLLRNPTGDPANGYRNPPCTPPVSLAVKPYECSWFGDGSTTIIDPSAKLHLVGSLVWQFDSANQLFVNATWTRNQFTFSAGPAGGSFLLPTNSAFYPQQFAQAFGLDGGPLNILWRAQELGPQTTEPTTEQLNVVAGMQGAAWGWTYDGAFNYSRGEFDTSYANGFFRTSALGAIFNTGIVNPFGANTADVIDRMSSARIDGVLQAGTSTLASFDFNARNDVIALPAGPMTLNVGINLMQERVARTADPALASGDVLGSITVRPLSGSRNIWAAFAEARIPIVDSLDADVAVRYDHYSEFGGTTNPKISLRWQPVPQLILRGSAGTGFLAPSLLVMSSPQTPGLTQSPLDDPARCRQSPQDCNRRFPTLGGGNPALRPVTSQQWSAGGVWAPAKGLSLGIDYVSILIDNQIFALSVDSQIFSGCPDGVTGPTCFLIHRGPTDPQYPALPGRIVQIDRFPTNLGKKKVSAVDVNVEYVAPVRIWGQMGINFTGTYNIEHLLQQADGSYNALVGTKGGFPGGVPRWRHYLVLNWKRGPWSATLTENYETGTSDQYPVAQPRKIGNYDIWNVAAAYSGFRHWTLSAGIKNLLDRNPPFSNQDYNPQVGYDPAYGDPHGRLYWVAVGYALK